LPIAWSNAVRGCAGIDTFILMSSFSIISSLLRNTRDLRVFIDQLEAALFTENWACTDVRPWQVSVGFSDFYSRTTRLGLATPKIDLHRRVLQREPVAAIGSLKKYKFLGVQLLI